MSNPYTERMGLSDPDLFVGRSACIRDALNSLTAAKPSSVAILGPSRIGKTALLQHVQRLVMAQNRQDVHCVDAPPRSLRNRDETFGGLALAVSRGIPSAREAARSVKTPVEFEDFICDNLNGGALLFFMDDIDDWSFPSPEVRFELYNTLRSLVWRNRVALCVTTRHPLVDLCMERQDMGSLLWNVFNNIEPGLLSEGEAKELVYGPHKREGLDVTDDEWKLVFEEAGPQPCMLQMAAYRLFEEKKGAVNSVLAAEQRYYLRQRIQHDISGYSRILAGYLEERSKSAVAAAVALARHEKVDDEQALQLINLGAAYVADGGVRLMSAMFEAYLQKKAAESSNVMSTAAARSAESEEPAQALRGGSDGGKTAALVFISANSKDYELAGQVYNFLAAHKIPAFFSEISLPKMGISEYRRAIDDALENAAHLVLVGSSLENIKSNWVEKEWGSFINGLLSGHKFGNLITLLAGSLTVRSLPVSLRNYEAIPLNPEGLEKALHYVSPQPTRNSS